MNRARQVIDYISWIEHCAWVQSVCDTPWTATAIFNAFQRSSSAERGRYVPVPPQRWV